MTGSISVGSYHFTVWSAQDSVPLTETFRCFQDRLSNVIILLDPSQVN